MLLEYYKKMCDMPNVNKVYYSTGDVQIQGLGKIYSLINTNYRNIYEAFINGFETLETVEGKPYSEWPRYENNENKYKHHTVRMRKAELFSAKNGIYTKTKRGLVFKNMINSLELNDSDKMLICYLLILTGYFSNTPNCIIVETKDAFDAFAKSGYSAIEILRMQEEFIKNSKNITKKKLIFEYDYPYIDSFCFQYEDLDFNKIFKSASVEDKRKFKDFIIKQIENNKSDCIISHKYVNGGNYTQATIEQSTFMLFMTENIINYIPSGFNDFINFVINLCNKVYNVNNDKLIEFINNDNNVGVFKKIYNQIYSIKTEKMVVETNIKELKPEEIQNLKIDTTDEEGEKKNEIITEALKKLAKVNSDYRCFMEEIEGCKYFTSKENNKNYLEVHHFIPHAFANDFDVSIENIDNYVPLCPHCHRKIHLAVDSEREYIIRYIYNKRKELLMSDNLIESNGKKDGKDFLNVLFEYYHIGK